MPHSFAKRRQVDFAAVFPSDRPDLIAPFDAALTPHKG
jgi:hypothetical protein